MYPSVEPGMLGAATLVDTNGRLSWQFLTQGSRYTLEKQRDTALFPATRFPEPKIPRTSTRRRAEEGVSVHLLSDQRLIHAVGQLSAQSRARCGYSGRDYT